MLAWNLEFILGIFIGAEETLGSIPILMDLSSLINQHTSFSNGLYTFYNTPPVIGSVTAIVTCSHPLSLPYLAFRTNESRDRELDVILEVIFEKNRLGS